MPRTKKSPAIEPADPQKSSAAQFLTYIAIQDRLFQSDYDRFLLELERQAKERGGGSASADGKDPVTP